MTEAQRQAYLDAMDIGVWVSKPATVDQDRMVIGPGSGSTLLVCRDSLESSTALAADICRFLADTPVWAWPDTEGSLQYPSLEEAINLGLYTRVVILGLRLTGQLFKGGIPKVLASAQIIPAPDLDELSVSARARKNLWLLCQKQPRLPLHDR